MSDLDRAKRLQMIRAAAGDTPAPALFHPRGAPTAKRPCTAISVPPKYTGPHRALANPMFTTLRR